MRTGNVECACVLFPSRLSLRESCDERQPLLSRSERRLGVTLLEVLISMFVILVGLLGVAALLPAGRQSAVEATKADRTGACGRAAEREIRIRDMLNTQMLLIADAADKYVDNAGNRNHRYPEVGLRNSTTNNKAHSQYGQYSNARPFVLDPWLLPALTTASTPNLYNYYVFPYGGTVAADRLPRVTVSCKLYPWTVKSVNSPTMQLSLGAALRATSARDDVVFDPPQLTGARPTYPVYKNSTGTDVYYPVQPVDGHYSWIATCQPEGFYLKQPANQDMDVTSYRVSVVVFYRRNVANYHPAIVDNTQAERFIPSSQLNFASLKNGQIIYSGSDVRINNVSSTLVDLRPGSWVMLSSTMTRPANSPLHYNVEWYRVVNYDQGSLSATLEGPDWDINLYGRPNMTIVQNAVGGVYSAIVPASSGTPWVAPSCDPPSG